LLLGVRGSCRFLDRSTRNWLCLERAEHSEKPERIRQIIETVSPGPYLELFGRRLARNWIVFGNEIDRGLFDGEIAEIN